MKANEITNSVYGDRADFNRVDLSIYNDDMPYSAFPVAEDHDLLFN